VNFDHALHADLIGVEGSRGQLNTPCLVLDLDALDANIAAMQKRASARSIKLRPHGKTHKSVDIARRQIKAGAVGLCCAKIGEAEAFGHGGIEGILITSPVTAPAAILRLAALATRANGLMAVVDNSTIVQKINDALKEQNTKLDVLIDIDPGIRRTGVANADDAIALAEVIGTSSHLNLRGVQFYCGIQQHIESYQDRFAAIVERTDYLKTIITALQGSGHDIDIVSGSGTGTFDIDLELGVFTELQTGSYVFMDRQYLECALTPSGGSPFAASLFVDARVVSANHQGMVTLDAGFKALSTDGGTPKVAAGPYQQAAFVFMGDEHSALIGSAIEQSLPPGALVTLTVPHCDPTVNLYDNYHVVRGDMLMDIWPVSARGRSR
jgi:3-hydroxy-D-aspartate aldolase